MNILTESEIFSAENIAKIEEKYTAKYVCETCLKGKDGEWVNSAVAIFWNKDSANIPAGGSAWFGMYWRPSLFVDGPLALFVTNAISAVEEPITGIMADNGDIIYSHYRHDYRRSPDGSVWIDGGRDYVRSGTAGGRFVTLSINDGELVVVE